MYKYTFGLWTLVLLSLNTWAQSPGRHCQHAVYGIVTDSETLEPLVYAKVFIASLGKGVITGENGEYHLDGLCDGSYELSVSHIGCGTVTFDLQVEEETHFDVQLPHSASHLDTVHIHDKHPGPKPTQGSSSLSGKELDATAGKSLGEAMKGLTGVSALQTGPSIFKPMIHGLHSNRILIMNNGVRQEGQQWGSEHGPEIDPFIADKLTAVKGAAGVRYGPDAIAGVILVEPADLPHSAGISGAVQLTGMSNGRQGASAARVEGYSEQLAGLAWRLQGSLKRGGTVRAPDYWLANTGLGEYNFSAAAGWLRDHYGAEVYYSQFNTDLGIFAGAHIGNLTDLENAIASDTPLVHSDFTYDIAYPKQHVTHELFKAKAYWHTGERSKLNLMVSRQYNLRQEFDADDDPGDPPALQYEITTHQAELMWEHDKWHHLRGQFGTAVNLQANTYEGALFIPGYRNRSIGFFAIERLVRLRWELEAGLRYDLRQLEAYIWNRDSLRVPEFDWQGWSGSFGGLWRASEHLSLRGNVSTTWRAPAVNELFSAGLHHGAAAVEIGDEGLMPEQTLNMVGTVSYREHERMGAELSVYRNFIRDFIYLQPVKPPTLTIRGAFPTFHYRQTDAVFVGTDLTLFWSPLERLRWEGKASILRTRNRSTGEGLFLMPADRFENSLSYEFGDKGILDDPRIGLSVVNVRRQHQSPDSLDYAPAPAAYALLNADVSTTFLLGKQRIDFGLGVSNLLNTRYRDYLNRFRYFTDEMGRNITFRIKIPFSYSPQSKFNSHE